MKDERYISNIRERYYMSLQVDFAQDLTHIFLPYIYSQLLMTIFKLMMPIESCIFYKNHISCNFMLKYYIGSRKIPTGKSPLRKIPTQKIHNWNIPTHFINFLSSLFLHLIFRS